MVKEGHPRRGKGVTETVKPVASAKPPPLAPDQHLVDMEEQETHTDVQMDEVKPNTSPPPAPPPIERATLFQLPKQIVRPPRNSAHIATKFTRRFRLG